MTPGAPLYTLPPELHILLELKKFIVDWLFLARGNHLPRPLEKEHRKWHDERTEQHPEFE